MLWSSANAMGTTILLQMILTIWFTYQKTSTILRLAYADCTGSTAI